MDIIKVKKKNHAFIEIDCEPSVANELCDFFTFFVPGYKFMPSYKNKVWDGKIRLFDTRQKELYAGLFKYVQEFANAEGRDYRIELQFDSYYGLPGADLDVDMSFINDLQLTAKGSPIQARDYQLTAIDHGLTKKSALLISPTASGKSLIIYSLIRYFLDNRSKRALIIVPTTSLVQQMYSDFGDYSTHDDGFNVETCHKIYSGRPKFATTERVVISTWQSIYKMPTEWFQQFGMVIGDEAHNFKAKSLTSILSKMKDAEFRYGTTGTLDGTQTHKLVLEGLFGPAFYVTTTKKLMDEGSLSELDISILLLKYSEETRRAFGKQKYQDEIDFLVSHEKRNHLIRNLALDQDGNTLVLFQYVEKHGKPLYNMIKEKAHSRRKIFYVSGETGVDTREEIRRITETEKNAIIVASLGTFSTGINIRNLHNIVFASPSKSQIKVLQSIGRGLRKSDDGSVAKLYDIADDLHWKSRKNYTLNHAAERIKIYTKEKFKYKIYEIEI
jgi:superfamily II DNA or RNA helicase|tara:strand:- start:2397 stop:3896 length:1500 start_codon:yes stop_codon:yes gene_type:complete